MIITYTDASWATRRDGSQGGQITILMEAKVLTDKQGRFPVLSWTSRRLRKVARSSTSAEVKMIGNATDTHEFVKFGYAVVWKASAYAKRGSVFENGRGHTAHLMQRWQHVHTAVDFHR